jgi:hypothetical protein
LSPDRLPTTIESKLDIIPIICSLAALAHLIGAMTGMMHTNRFVIEELFPLINSVLQLPPLKKAMFAMISGQMPLVDG